MILEPIERIEITKDDITNIKIDAIVNSTTPNMMGGANLDGKVHKVAGPELRAECMELGGCVAGNAKITKGYNLPARRVIHTVGPIYIDGHHSEGRILEMCYENCLKVLNLNDLDSIAFPSISSGTIGFPMADASKIALTTVLEELKKYPKIKRVVFCCYNDDMYTTYQNTLSNLKKIYNK